MNGRKRLTFQGRMELLRSRFLASGLTFREKDVYLEARRQTTEALEELLRGNRWTGGPQ